MAVSRDVNFGIDTYPDQSWLIMNMGDSVEMFKSSREYPKVRFSLKNIGIYSLMKSGPKLWRSSSQSGTGVGWLTH